MSGIGQVTFVISCVSLLRTVLLNIWLYLYCCLEIIYSFLSPERINRFDACTWFDKTVDLPSITISITRCTSLLGAIGGTIWYAILELLVVPHLQFDPTHTLLYFSLVLHILLGPHCIFGEQEEEEGTRRVPNQD